MVIREENALATTTARFLHDDDGHYGANATAVADSATFDPRVFWTANVLFFTVLIIVLVWCFRGGAERISNYISNNRGGPRSASDLEYLQRVRDRRAREREEKKETPEKRMKSLKDSFERNKVLMVVKANDFVVETDESSSSSSSLEDDSKEVAIGADDKSVGGEQVESVSGLVAAETERRRKDETGKTMTMTTPALDEPETTSISSIDVASSHGESRSDPSYVELDAPNKDDDEEDGVTVATRDDASSASIVTDDENNSNASSLEENSNICVDLGTSDVVQDSNCNRTMTEQDHTFALNAAESGSPAYVQLRLASGKRRTVPNCCAVCLCCYEEDETIVWSSNEDCKHAFHQDCVIEWLIKMQDGTPCPCCRQEFTDLNEHKDAPKKAHRHQVLPSFDINVVHL